MSNVDLILRLFLQLAVILAACRLVGMVGRRLGQAQVVCEMITGVLLGPSLFLGASMSITAFPMLARLIQQYQIARTKLGTLVLTTASVDDIAA
jgi:Kef-type K+ transport system membrane component KefB